MKRWRILGLIASLAMALLLIAPVASGASTASTPACTHVFCSTDPQGGYAFTTTQSVRNNEWNCPCGPQEVWADSTDSWGIITDQAAGNTAVLSYPDLQTLIYSPISKYSTMQGHYDFSMPKTGDFEAAYDIWLQDSGQYGWANDTEIMVWVDNHGQTPAGSVVAHPVIKGVAYTLWAAGGKMGGGPYTFVRDVNQTRGTARLLSIFTYLQQNGYVSSNVYDLDIEFGWEVCSTGGLTENFTMHSDPLTLVGKVPATGARRSPQKTEGLR